MGDCMNNEDIYELAQRDLETTLERIAMKVNENNNINAVTRAMYNYNELGEKCYNFDELKQFYDKKQDEFEQLQKELTTMRSHLEQCEQSQKVHIETIDIDEILEGLSRSLERIYRSKLANSENFVLTDLNDFEIIKNS
tara:strand:+ start:80 stop:496 length:417 start_codon:yes stop_codon:yes gene_type:complete